MSDAPIFDDPELEAHFNDFMAKFKAAGEVARSARISGWGMSMATDSETITLTIKQPPFVPTTTVPEDGTVGTDGREATGSAPKHDESSPS